jgi:hypothetical protein
MGMVIGVVRGTGGVKTRITYSKINNIKKVVCYDGVHSVLFIGLNTIIKILS